MGDKDICPEWIEWIEWIERMAKKPNPILEELKFKPVVCGEDGRVYRMSLPSFPGRKLNKDSANREE